MTTFSTTYLASLNDPNYVSTSDSEYASKTYANIIRSQYEDYQERFQPYENRLMDLAQSRELLDDQLSRITANVSASYDNPQNSAGNLAMQRYGVSMNAQEQAKSTRQNEMSKALALADAKNNTRIANADQQDAIVTGTTSARALALDNATGG
jgi:hypothetical protein